MRLATSALALSMSITPLLVGCIGAPSESGPEAIGKSQQPIKNGTAATGYPEAALVDLCADIQGNNCEVFADCSGSVIAPQVVLTAGHCVYGCINDGSNCQGQIFPGWIVETPFAGGQQVGATSGVTYDWTNTSETVNPNMHDIGLIFLSQPITLSSYPTLAQTPLANGGQIVNIGRIQSGQLSDSQLFQGIAVATHPGSQEGYPYDYTAQDIIESGDSGGPDVIPNTHTIVAVNSGGGSDEVLARVDLVYDWIQQQITQNGGTGSSTSTTGTGTGTTTGTGTSTGTGAMSCDDCANAAETGACAAQANACGGNQDCLNLDTCIGNCAAGDQACVSTCESTYPNGLADLQAFDQCICTTACVSECAASCGTSSSSSGTASGTASGSSGTGTLTGTGTSTSTETGVGGGDTGAGGSGHTSSKHNTNDDGGCSVTNRPASPWASFVGLGLAAVFAARRRRR